MLGAAAQQMDPWHLRQCGAHPGGRTSVFVFLAILAATFAMRWPFLGHPMIHVDEQFYLLTGQRMIEGYVPYVDIWDRKPVGLFLIFGAIRLLGGEGILEYQLVATIFVAATAHTVYAIAKRGVTSQAAFAAGLAYCAMLAPINGAGGQSPIFYNLFMAWSVLLVLRAGDESDPKLYQRFGLCGMLCAGLALQIKYIAVVEGVFLGLWLVFLGSRHGGGPIVMVRRVGQFAGAALFPTLAALAVFAAIGAFEPFFQANFVSIFQRGAAPVAFEYAALSHTLWLMTLPLACTGAALLVVWLRGPSRDRTFLTVWLGFSVVGFLAIGNYYDHYALPVILPIAVILSRLFAQRLWGPVSFGLLIAQATLFGLMRYPSAATSRAVVNAMTAEIAPATAAGACLYVTDTPLILYLTSKACGPWRYSFPFHLLDGTEANTGESDQSSAMRRALASRPGAIITGHPDFTPLVQKENVSLLNQTLAEEYVLVGQHPDRGRHYSVWLRHDLASREPSVGAKDGHRAIRVPTKPP